MPRSGSGEGHQSGRTGLFNASLEGNKWWAIDFHKGDQIDEDALKIGKYSHSFRRAYGAPMQGSFFISKRRQYNLIRSFNQDCIVSGLQP
ncbi:hypothetical protein FHS14_006256 [Paenibacillus baekrokdamisoli]|nr:hypothetical protein [Paenibacillus baekrokdamisoli]